MGGAERLLALDHRRRDRRAGRGRRRSPSSTATPADARIWLATADQYQRTIKGWTVTTNGPLSSQPYFIRLSKTGDPNAAISYNVGNGGPTLDQRSVIDAGFLELVRLGELSADRPGRRELADRGRQRPSRSRPPAGRAGCATTATATATATSCRITPARSRAGRGRRRTRAPGTSGRCCPPSAAQQDLATGQADVSGPAARRDRSRCPVASVSCPSRSGTRPNVAASPFGTDPTVASIGFVNGKPDGSAAPLTWGAGSLVRLTADLSAGRVLEQPAQTVDRYVTHTQLATTLTVTSPPDQTAATNPIHVTGTAVPGATVDVADVGTSTTTHASGTAAADGSFSFDIAPLVGNNVLVVTSTAPNGGTAQAVRTVVNDVVEGTLLLRQHRPDRRRQRAGQLRLPDGRRTSTPARTT